MDITKKIVILDEDLHFTYIGFTVLEILKLEEREHFNDEAIAENREFKD
jgi:hypothetical protein